MKPIKYEYCNDILKAPIGKEDKVTDLPITRVQFEDGVTGVESCWQLSDEELEEIKLTKRIYFIAIAETHPPILLTSKSCVSVENKQ